ncbi:NAD(P)-binding protein [Gymnopus androsaceus JB14]|uniref:NAD(P)-binding protein n=1 Tax=Gymnopus androsaceus JB14 TaxID=1447944 RepID=A0A6A4HEK7_9AGAR|nr:NAD(P)-binding protein [Gymnopus androsaceus JB14]
MLGQGSEDHQYSPLRLFNVEGLVAVVTGGGTGIGLMMAAALENNGAIVYIVGRRLDVLQQAAQENNRFNNIIPLHGDVTNRESLLSIVQAVKARHGYIDLLVNNAGIARNLYSHPLPSPDDSCEIHSPPSPPASPSCEPSHPSIKQFQSALWDSGTPDDFAETFSTNVTAPYYTTVAFLDLLHQVITVSSSGSFRVDPKIVSMSELLAPWGIRSNVLAPGVWPSEMTNSSLTPSSKLDPRTMAMSVPLKRAGTEEEMAGTILFLASKAGAYVNGAVWLIDGGRVGSVASSY